MSARSYLFVPGNRPERFEKARNAGADAVILDLEDAVQPQEKERAREVVLEALDPSRPVLVRINAADTAWFSADVAALSERAGVAGIVLPKAESREQVEAVLKPAHAGLAILPIIETARGVSNLTALCSTPRVSRVLFGTLDFQADMNIEGDGIGLDAFRSQIVLASRLAGIDTPVDGVSTTLDDPDVIERESRRSRRFGFGAKLCIHPKQIEPVHRAFAWTADETSWAARVLQAVEESGGAAVAVDGKMVDMPVILKARRILNTY
jgi:citrate lyase subunit beta/citryl-CoA lyase